MRRREFTALLGSVASAWPLAALAQQRPLPVLGFLNAESRQGYARPLAGFLKGLGESGYEDGRNVAIEYRWAESQNDRLPEMAADLVRRQVAVIAATTTPATDPVRLGLVASLNRPGGNVTGVTQTNAEVAPKLLQLLHELLPTARTMGLLINPASGVLADNQLRNFLAAAQTLGVELQVLKASTDGELDAAFADVVKSRAGGIVISTDPFFTSHGAQLAALASRNSVAAVYWP